MKTTWETLPAPHQADIAKIVRQWHACPLHVGRVMASRCKVCKRARDTAQAKWEELHPEKAAKYARRVGAHDDMDKYLRKYGVGVIGIT